MANILAFFFGVIMNKSPGDPEHSSQKSLKKTTRVAKSQKAEVFTPPPFE